MEKSIKNKIIASILIFILTLANFQGIITEGIGVLASSIENQNSKTNHKNVDFNAQFMVIDNEKKYSIRENISKEEIYLNIFTEIKEAGYLKSGNIMLKDEDGNEANFNLVEIEEPEAIQNIDYTKNEIILNQINNNEKLDINIPIKLMPDEVFDLNNFSKDTIVTFSGIYVDAKGEEKEISKEIELKAEWKEEAQAVLTEETIKVLSFEKGIVISEKVQLGVQDSKLPIKTAVLEINVPKIEEVLPTEVRVENTNTTLNIDKEYEDGKLSITLENKVSENDTIIWKKALEELQITYIFENLEAVKVTEATTEANLDVECYSSEKKVVSAESKNTINISDTLGNVIEENLVNSDIIYKGNMLNTGIETEFKVVSNIDISYEKLVEKVEVKYNKDKFVIAEEEIDANTYYKKLAISKENFTKILGDEGELKVYSGDTILATIDSNIEADEDGNLIFSFDNNEVSEIKIETTKPVYSGKLKVGFLKKLSGQSELTKEEIKNISYLKLESDINENIKEAEIEMKNPTTKIGLDINTNILSTVVENKGVEFTVTLNNNSLSLDLFKNPQIELRLPNSVTDLNINTVQLLLEDELELKNYEYVKDTNSIVINLEGTQTKYNLSEMNYGATIIVNTDITVDKLSVNKKDKVKLFVINELSTGYESVLEEKGYSEKDINIVAPLGLIALNSAEVNNEEEKEVTEENISIGGNEVAQKIEANAETKTATMKITAINNYDSVINNIRILGRIPFVGNKSLIDGTDLGTTFNAILKDKIISEALNIEKFDIYYSENGDATEDLNLEENGWVLESEDLSKIKSYLIVLKKHEMQIGEKIEFKYDIEVPADLELGNSAHGTYIIYYDNKKDDVVFENTSVPSVIGLTTGEAPELEVSIVSDVAEDEPARSGQIIKYTIKVKNIGKVDSTQVFITTDIPEGLTYAELVLGGNYEEDYYKLNPEKKSFNKLIGDLAVGQEEIVEYLVRVNENLDSAKEIKSKVMLSAKDLPEMIESAEVKNLIDNGNMLIELKSDVKEDEKVKTDENITYTAQIRNISDYDINNVVAKIELPHGTQYKNAYIKNSDKKIEYNENTRTITWNLEKLAKEAYLEVVFEVITTEENNAEFCVKASGENVEEHKSNILKLNICKANITVKQESTIPEGYVSSGDEIEYKIEVANRGNLDAVNLQIIDSMPEGMKYIETSYRLKGINKTIKSSNNNEAKLEINVPANETLNMTVKVKADETDTEKQATNIVKVINDGAEIEANKLTHIIEAKTLGNTR